MKRKKIRYQVCDFQKLELLKFYNQKLVQCYIFRGHVRCRIWYTAFTVPGKLRQFWLCFKNA